ncbi:MAG: transposase [Acidobacteria bacterium]|nr:transposase [Acidobacteriota bacterium]MCA1648972.1 transposase [Acidobacteriota bacterium]
MHVGEQCIVVALGIDHTGPQTRALPLGWLDGECDGGSELLNDLQSRGLCTDRSGLVILDGSKGAAQSVTQTFGSAALIQRCQVHYADVRIMPIPSVQACEAAAFPSLMSA